MTAEHDGFVCPNGHPVDPVRVHNCRVCRQGVVYEPHQRGLLYLRALHRAHAALEVARAHTDQTLTDSKRWPRPSGRR